MYQAPSKCLNMWIQMDKLDIHISKSNHNIEKNLFVLGSYKYLVRLEGKIRKCFFFYVRIL